MVWLTFFISTAILVLAAVRLSRDGDVIAVRTNLGGAFIGTLLLAGATSLPELLTAISAVNAGEPALSVGNFFGSSMFNMALIGALDLFYRQGRLLHRVAINHALTAGLAILLTTMAVFFIQAQLNFRVGWVGVDTLLILAVYIIGTFLIQQNNSGENPPASVAPESDLSHLPSLRRALIGFAGATVALVIVTPQLVDSSIEIAAITGLSTGFVGTALLAIVTSLPEVVTTIAAVRIRAFDLAVGNLFGSNIFNIFALGIADVFYTNGSLLLEVDASLSLVGLLALILTGLALVGNLTRVERRIAGIIEVDALLLLLTYIGGMFFLYQRGIGL